GTVLARGVAAVGETPPLLARAGAAPAERGLDERGPRPPRPPPPPPRGGAPRAQDGGAASGRTKHREAPPRPPAPPRAGAGRQRADRDGEIGAPRRRARPRRLDGAGRVLADRPGVTTVRQHERLAAGAAHHLGRRLPRLPDARLAAVHLEEEARPLDERERE